MCNQIWVTLPAFLLPKTWQKKFPSGIYGKLIAIESYWQNISRNGAIARDVAKY